MSEAQPVEGQFQGQLQEDLRFVREAVAHREASARPPITIYWVWAVYVLVGYSMIDLAPRYCGWFFMIGGVVGGTLSTVLGRRADRLRREAHPGARPPGGRPRAGGRGPGGRRGVPPAAA